MWTVPWILVSLGLFWFVVAVTIDIHRCLYEDHITRFEKVYGED